MCTDDGKSGLSWIQLDSIRAGYAIGGSHKKEEDLIRLGWKFCLFFFNIINAAIGLGSWSVKPGFYCTLLGTCTCSYVHCAYTQAFNSTHVQWVYTHVHVHYMCI